MERPLEEAMAFHVLPSVRLLEQMRERELRSFVRLSTVLLYDETRAAMPVVETSPIAPYRNRYLLSQYLGEQAAHYYERYFPVATLRLCNLFGPWPGERTDLVHEVITQLRRAGRATIRTRVPERDFLFVDDAAGAVGALARAGSSGLFHVGAGEAVPVGRVVDILSGLSGCPVESREEPVTGIVRISINSEKLRAATGWAPRYSLEEGMARTWRASDAAGH
jgi:UDP-glucose 4-epimerase